MVNIKSAAKRLRQDKKRRLRNRIYRGRIRAGIKQIIVLTNEGDYDAAQALVSRLYSAIDRARKRGIIHKNTAARYKSRVAHIVARPPSKP